MQLNEKMSVHLYGWLAEKYGELHHVFARNAVEVASYLQARFGDFDDLIKDQKIALVQGDLDTGECLEADQVGWTLGKNQLHIVPEAMGSKGSGGMLKMLLGAVLIGVAVFASGGTLAGLGAPIFGNALGISGTSVALLGLGMVAAGLVMPKSKPKEKPEERASSIYSGPLNTQATGQPVPVVFGRGVIVGGQVIHAALDIENTAILYYPTGETRHVI